MAKKKSGKWFYIIGAIFVGAWLVSRQADTGSKPSRVVPRTASKPVATATPALSVPQATPLATPLAVATPTPIPLPTAVPIAVPVSASITTYRVVGISDGDYLNLRAGPSQNNPIVQRLQNGHEGITLVGSSVDNGGTVWQKVDSQGTQGWAVMTYLAASTVITVKPALPANAQPTPVKDANPPSDNYVPSEVRLTSSTAFPVFERGVQTGLNAPPIGTKVKLLKVTGYNVIVEYKGQQKSISAAGTDLLQRMLGTADD